MATTALLVDIVIVGIQILLWLSGFIFSFFLEPRYLVEIVNIAPTLFIIVFIALAYTIGITADHLISRFFYMFLKSEDEKKLYDSVSTVNVVGSDHSIHTFLNNHYERLRIARATLINIPMLTFASVCLLLTQDIPLKMSVCAASILVISLGLIFLWLAYVSWKSRNATYIKYIKEAKERFNNN